MTKSRLDRKIHEEYPKVRQRDGDLGIEIETEGRCYMVPDGVTPWNYWHGVADGSLRHGLEYILQRPITVKELKPAMAEWELVRAKSKFTQSIRTSLHVHVNAAGITLQEIYNFLGSYWLLENILVGLNGKIREGNLFCLRVCDAYDYFTAITRDLLQSTFFRNLGGNHYRYSALNLASLFKFGSVEFRFMKGTVDSDEIQEWASGLHHLFHYSKGRSLPTLLENVNSLETPAAISDYLQRYLGPLYGRTAYHYSSADLKRLLHENIDLVYTLNNKLDIFREREVKHKSILLPGALDDIEPEEGGIQAGGSVYTISTVSSVFGGVPLQRAAEQQAIGLNDLGPARWNDAFVLPEPAELVDIEPDMRWIEDDQQNQEGDQF